MASEKPEKMADRLPEQDQFLAAVDAKIMALQQLRASYVAAVSIGAFGAPGDAAPFAVGATPAGFSGLGGTPMELPQGALLGKSLPAAIKLYLGAIKRKQTIRDIANALREHGVESTAKNFEVSVTSAVYRLRAAHELLKFKDGWALAELYPDSLRRSITEKNSAARPRRAKKRGAKSQTVKPDTVAQGNGSPGLEKKIESFLKEQARGVAPSAVAQALNTPPSVVGPALGRLKKRGRVTKESDGTYALSK